MKISTYDKPVKGMQTGGPGRAPSAETLALQAAIEASAKDGKARRWEGGAKEYKKNGQKIRGIAHTHTTPDAPLGFGLSVGLDGDDLTFLAKVKVKDEKPAEKPQEKAEEKATPTPPKKAPAKATQK